jgi:hypothetical protein
MTQEGQQILAEAVDGASIRDAEPAGVQLLKDKDTDEVGGRKCLT